MQTKIESALDAATGDDANKPLANNRNDPATAIAANIFASQTAHMLSIAKCSGVCLSRLVAELKTKKTTPYMENMVIQISGSQAEPPVAQPQ